MNETDDDADNADIFNKRSCHISDEKDAAIEVADEGAAAAAAEDGIVNILTDSLGKDPKLIGATFNEFQGTFILSLVVHCLIHYAVPNGGIYAGATLTALVYFGATVSGAHYNPAVTLGLAASKKLGASDVSIRKTVLYVVAQLLGGLFAAVAHYIGQEVDGVPTDCPASSHEFVTLFFTEAIFTAFLVLTVLHTAVSKATTGNSYFGMAIGFTVIASGCMRNPEASLFLGALNPAISFSLFIQDKINVTSCVVACLGELVGAAYAAVVFTKLTNPDIYVE